MRHIVKFYKYQPLSEEKHFEFLQNYLNQRVWLTPLKNFNDPFEGRFSFVSFSPEYILTNPKIFDELLKQHNINGEPDLTVDEFKKRLSSAEFGEALKSSTQIVKNIFSNHGALCLTTKNNNIPMWAYYADNHKGYCIEFELDFSRICHQAKIDPCQIEEFMSDIHKGSGILSFNLDKHSQEFVFTKIRYDKVMPAIHFEEFIEIKNQYEQIEYVVRNSVGVKFIEWIHENEFRLIANSNSQESGLLPLEGYAPFLKVTGVIIGSQMTEENANRVNGLCKEHAVNIYKAACSESTYEIVITSDDNVTKIASVHGAMPELIS